MSNKRNSGAGLDRKPDAKLSYSRRASTTTTPKPSAISLARLGAPNFTANRGDHRGHSDLCSFRRKIYRTVSVRCGHSSTGLRPTVR